MDTKDKEAKPQVEPVERGFFASLIHRLDHAMKATADKKAAQGCCGSADGSQDKSGKGGRCC